MLVLIALFILVPIAELYVIIQVGEAIGVLPTILLLLLDAVLGSLLLRHQGRGAWRRFNEAIAQRRFPGKEVADGLLIVVGGTLLLAPGFLTDIVGVFLLIPPTRAIARSLLRRFTVGRFTVVNIPGAGPFGGGPDREWPRRDASLRLRRQRRGDADQRRTAASASYRGSTTSDAFCTHRVLNAALVDLTRSRARTWRRRSSSLVTRRGRRPSSGGPPRRRGGRRRTPSSVRRPGGRSGRPAWSA